MLYNFDVSIPLGLKNYRFSIAWSRLFPTPTGPPNAEGFQFYNNLMYLYNWGLLGEGSLHLSI